MMTIAIVFSCQNDAGLRTHYYCTMYKLTMGQQLEEYDNLAQTESLIPIIILATHRLNSPWALKALIIDEYASSSEKQ